MEELGQK
ncbi:hypothetical protein CIB84_001132 [Bambusicola thoracicus]|nr:hypothetical protein CIB84_001132 [Bambusicola thoracicus]